MKIKNTFFAIMLLTLILNFNNSFSQYSLVYKDFEDNTFPPAGWNAYMWNQEYYISGYGEGSKSAVLQLYYYCYGNYPMETSSFSPSVTGDSLIFDYAYAPYDYNNYHDLKILYSTDDGSSYNDLYTLSGYPDGELTTSMPNQNYYSPNYTEWKTFRYELPDGTTNIKFEPIASNFKWGCSNNLFLDNIKIGHEVPYPDVAVKNVYSKGRFARSFLTNDTISAYIKNTGNQEATNLKVYLNISGTNPFSDSVTISSLPVGSFQVVNFKPFTPSINGNGIVKVSVIHNDENSDNDSALYNLNVNSNYLSYNDTTVFINTFGYSDRIYFFNKYRIANGNSRISEIRTRIQNIEGNYIKDQIITGVLLNSAGTIVAKSAPYKLQTSDTGKYISMKLSNPLPYYPAIANSYIYAGIETSSPIRDEYFFSFTGQIENPQRLNAYFYSNDRSKEPGENIQLNDLGLYNYGVRYDLQVRIDTLPLVDAGISNIGNLYDQYYSISVIPQSGKVYNNAVSGTANATVIRTITPGGYTSSQSVSIPPNSSVNVTYANWTFSSGTTYTIRDSVILSGDVNLTNNSMSGPVTPRIAKDLVIFYQKQDDRDSIERAIITDGRYANNYDAVDLNYSGSFRPWKIIFANPKYSTIFQNKTRDSLKAFIDNSTPGNKKTLIVFANKLANSFSYSAEPGDSVFLKQYLKTEFVSYDWTSYYYDSENRFKGNQFFSGVTQDSISLVPENPYAYGGELPDLIKPVNGGSIAFLPQTADTSNDHCNAVSFKGTNYNTFFMTNRFSALRATGNSPSNPMGPVRIYSKIIDWLQNINTGVKFLDMTAMIEGFYDENTNVMISDTVRVYLRSSVFPYNVVEVSKAYLNSAGQASFIFNNAVNGTGYFLQLKHRNGLETWSNTPGSFNSGQMSYDFTTDITMSYGSNMILKGTKWTFFSGDVNQDGTIDAGDLSQIENDVANSLSGYESSDLTGDDYVDATDLSIVENNVALGVSAITP